MQRKKNLAIIIILLFTTVNLFAQYSPYTRFGLGDLTPKGYGQSYAMGGSGIGLRSFEHINATNPASLATIPLNTFLFEFGVNVKYKTLETAADEQTYANGNLAYGAIGFACTKWWGTSVGFSPYSTVDYSIFESGETDYGVVHNFYDGQGGLSKLQWSNAIELHKTLSVGATASYIFGPLDYKLVSAYLEDDYSATTTSTNTARFSDFNFSYGLQFAPKVGRNFHISLGLVAENEQKLEGTVSRFMLSTQRYNISNSNASFALTDTIVNDQLANGNVLLPGSYGGGIAMQIDSLFGNSDALLITADYRLQDWSKATVFGNKTANLGMSRTISGGLQYIPAILAKSYWDVIRYRAGFRYSESYITLNNNMLKEYVVTFGAALPMRGTRSLVNIGVELGTFGTTDNSLVKEKYAGLSVNLTLADMWFVKRKFD